MIGPEILLDFAKIKSFPTSEIETSALFLHEEFKKKKMADLPPPSEDPVAPAAAAAVAGVEGGDGGVPLVGGPHSTSDSCFASSIAKLYCNGDLVQAARART